MEENIVENNEVKQNVTSAKKQMSKSQRTKRIVVSVLVCLLAVGIGILFLFATMDQVRSRNLAAAFDKTGFNYVIVNNKANDFKNIGKNLQELIKEAEGRSDAGEVTINVKNCGAFKYSEIGNDDYCYGYYFHIERGCDEVYNAFKKLKTNVNGNATIAGFRFALIQKGKVLFLVNYPNEYKEDELPEPLNELIKKVHGKMSITYYDVVEDAFE